MQVKNISLFLLDGQPLGRIKCTVGNWIGVAYKVPRDEIERSKDRTDLKQFGVYFLFGELDDKPAVYIGQASNLLAKLLEHRQTENFWTTAVAFTTSNYSLGLTEVSFLENKFCRQAAAAGRYEIKNPNALSSSNVTEEKEIELEEFAEYVRVVMLILGYKIFESIIEQSAVVSQSSSAEPVAQELLYLSRRLKSPNVTITATCRKIGERYIVLAGSKIAPVTAKYISDNIKNARRKAKISEENILLEDYTFDTPSGAAVFVLGMSANGWTEWRNKDGVPLNDLQR